MDKFLGKKLDGRYEIMEIIGKEESLTRIRKGIELLEAAE